ncbi:hypothetical protein EHS13_28175 [Paenibacillus psychroresistens]|uniref:Glycosyltransferase RgtA/B/C/D-like domain-containing protein n=1 Tax=Paenibacillus psychroresistens TaxID=1778678 RepID=A0A6B8RSP7_9BACL|nr:hypothetical protein [Paenibacillus psychroresistens]QGQ98483.1 hypothetical protein EHS13_28175 [Paenibacillus psychroresistens]
MIGIICIFIAILFQIIPYNKLILNGVFKYPSNQIGTIQSGIEFLCLLILFFGMSFIKNRNKFVISFLVVIFLFLLFHQVLLAAVLGIVYFEIIIMFGSFIFKILSINSKDGIRKYLDFFIVGLTIWCFLAIVLSFAGYGNINCLRVLTIFIALISFINHKCIPLVFCIVKEISISNILERLFQLFITLTILVQYGKLTNVIDFDSMMYGLRPEYVLFGESSFFDNLGYVLFPYYYPKLFELFLAPLSNLDSFSFIYSGNVFVLILLTLTIYIFIRENGSKKIEALIVTSVTISIPMVSNMASTAKPDLFNALIIVLATFYFWNWIKTNNFNSLILGLIGSTISLSIKFNSFLFVPLIIFGVFILRLINNKYEIKYYKKIKTNNYPIISILILSFLVLLGVCYRTFILTGYPIFPLLSNLWGIIGFKLKYPFLNLNIVPTNSLNFMEIIKHWYHLVLDPNKYSNFAMIWPGNLYIFLLIITTLLSFMHFNKKNYKLFFVVLPMFIAFIYFLTTAAKGGDGNYYLAPVILIIVTLIKPLLEFNWEIKRLILACLILFIPLQLFLVLVSHSSWTPGMSKLTISGLKLWSSSKTEKHIVFQDIGLLEIEKYLETNNKANSRCIGYGPDGIMHQLSCGFEYIPHVVMAYGGNSTIGNNRENFLNYLEWGHIRFIIRPKAMDLEGDSINKTITELKADPKVHLIESADFTMLDISDLIY